MRLLCLVRKTIQHLSRAPPVAMLWSTRLLHFVFFVPSGSIHHCVGVGADTKARQSERRDWGHFGAAANQFAFSTIGDVAFAVPVRGHCVHHGSAVLRGLFTSSCFPSSSAPYPLSALPSHPQGQDVRVPVALVCGHQGTHTSVLG